jgi:hypothetical protein
VLGTASAWGPVDVMQPGGEWHSFGGGALLEGVQVRTRPDGRAILELTNGDVVALGGSSSLRVARGPRVALVGGRLGVRFQESSPLVVDTPATRVALPAFRPVATGFREALIGLEGSVTTVRSFRGTIEATRPGDVPIMVAEHQTLAVGPAEAGVPPGVGDIQIPPGPKTDETIWAALGLSPGMAAVLGGALAVGGGVGGAAAAGAFSSSDAASTGGPTPDQGSPFRPIRRLPVRSSP